MTFISGSLDIYSTLAKVDFSFKCPIVGHLLEEIFLSHFTEGDLWSSTSETVLQKAQYFKRLLGGSVLKLFPMQHRSAYLYILRKYNVPEENG